MSHSIPALDTTELVEHYQHVDGDLRFRDGKQLVRDLEIRAGEHVLEVGSGTGLLAEHVAQVVGPLGWVMGIDPLPLRVEIASRKSGPNLSFRVGNSDDLGEFPSESFDVVCLNAAFHRQKNRTAPLREIHRVLRPGGRIGVTTGSGERPGSAQVIRNHVLGREPYSRHAPPEADAPRCLTLPELVRLFEQTGFEARKVEILRDVHFHPTPASIIRSWDANRLDNFVGHLPEDLRDAAIHEVAAELEQDRTARGIRVEDERIVGIAVKT